MTVPTMLASGCARALSSHCTLHTVFVLALFVVSGFVVAGTEGLTHCFFEIFVQRHWACFLFVEERAWPLHGTHLVVLFTTHSVSSSTTRQKCLCATLVVSLVCGGTHLVVLSTIHSVSSSTTYHRLSY